MADRCKADPGFYDCSLIGQHVGASMEERAAPRLPQDARLKALVIATPALGFTFTREGLKAVKWGNLPMYGVEEGRWFTSIHCYTKYVLVTFFEGASMEPVPAGPSKLGNVRYHDIREDGFDDSQLISWIRQAVILPQTKV